MKLLKKIVIVAVILCLCISLSPAALAAEADAAAETEAAAATEAPESTDAAEAEDIDALPYSADQSWEEIVSALMTEYEADPEDVYIGYMNLVTGEEYYQQGDEFVIAASMYKLPLSMAITERISTGELDWNAYYPSYDFDYALDEVIINSNNETAGLFYDLLGGYDAFRLLVAESYLDTDPNTENSELYFDNKFTAHQLISCLKTLYDEPDRFPGVLDDMLVAEPERFFRFSEQRYDIAQKYGFWQDEYFLNVYMNDCGIVYTEEPIALVMFTYNTLYAEELLGAYCTAMCDYTEARTAQRKLDAEAEAASEAAQLTQEAAVSISPDVSPEVYEEAAAADDTVSAASYVLPGALILALVIVCIAVLAMKKRKTGIKVFSALLCIILSAAAMLLCVVGVSTGTIYAKPQGDPQATVTEFFEALKAEDYTLAYEQLRDYTSLGLETEPTTEAAKLAGAALRQSYDYELLGDCEVDKLEAKQKVRMTYLNLALTQDAVEQETMNNLEDFVQSRSLSEVYDADSKYLPEVANEAYIMAVGTVVSAPEQYYGQIEFTLSLSYTDGEWKIIANSGLLKALNGGAGY